MNKCVNGIVMALLEVLVVGPINKNSKLNMMQQLSVLLQPARFSTPLKLAFSKKIKGYILNENKNFTNN